MPKAIFGKFASRSVPTLILYRLLDAARVKPSGLAEIEAAQNDGRWQNAYDSRKNV